MKFKDVLLRTRRVLSLYKVYGDIALLVLNGTSLNIINALLALSRRLHLMVWCAWGGGGGEGWGCLLAGEEEEVRVVNGVVRNDDSNVEQILILSHSCNKTLTLWGKEPCNPYIQLRARRELSLFNNVPLRTRRALSLYKVYGDNALLVLSRTARTPFRFLADDMSFQFMLWEKEGW